MATYYLYIYSPDDFVSGLPAEASAAAAGSPNFILTLKPDAEPTVVAVDDDDTIFDEIDSTQALAQDVTIDGTSYAAGTTINTAYDLINTGTGHKVTSFHFGGSGYQQGAVDGLVSTVELLPGQSYTFNAERTSHRQNNPYDGYVACFTAGICIATPDGPKAVERLRVGDMVLTMDGAAQPLAWVGARNVAGIGPFAPILLPKGWNGLERDLLISPQHRMLIDDPRCELLFGERSVLVSAKHLAEIGIGRVTPMPLVSYVHIMFDTHEIVWAEGAPSESLMVTDRSLAGLAADAAAEIRALFPELNAPAMQAARPILKGFEARAILGTI